MNLNLFGMSQAELQELIRHHERVRVEQLSQDLYRATSEQIPDLIVERATAEDAMQEAARYLSDADLESQMVAYMAKQAIELKRGYWLTLALEKGPKSAPGYYKVTADGSGEICELYPQSRPAKDRAKELASIKHDGLPQFNNVCVWRADGTLLRRYSED
jgi:hypothetical protein